MFRINKPSPGTWQQITGTGSRHGFKVESATLGTDRGFSLVGTTKGGKVFTEEGTELTLEDANILRLEVDPTTNDASMLFRKSARTSWPSPIWLRQWSSLPSANDQIQTLEFRQGADVTEDGILCVSYQEWPNGAWSNGTVPEDYFRLYTATGPSWDSTNNILEFHSAPIIEEIDIPPASWAQRGMNAPSGGSGGANTPRRVTPLPANADSLKGEEVYNTADYNRTTGFDVTPVPFAETTIDGLSAGTRGWWRGAGGFALGRLNHDDSEIDDVALISDTRVYVKRGTLTNLAKIYLGSNSYALTRVPQTAGTKLIYNVDGSPDVDYYTITGGLPAGDWNEVRFETTTAGTFIPLTVVVKEGPYIFGGTNWQKVPKRRTDAEINDLTREQVPQQFRNDADVTGQNFQPTGFWEGTQTQFDALTKTEGTLYFIS